MLFMIDKNSPYKKNKKGLLEEDSLLKLRSITTYFTTRANLPLQQGDREKRRLYLQNKDYVSYKKAILEREKEKEKAQSDFVDAALKAINLDMPKYLQSHETVKYSVLGRVLEDAVL